MRKAVLGSCSTLPLGNRAALDGSLEPFLGGPWLQEGELVFAEPLGPCRDVLRSSPSRGEEEGCFLHSPPHPCHSWPGHLPSEDGGTFAKLHCKRVSLSKSGHQWDFRYFIDSPAIHNSCRKNRKCRSTMSPFTYVLQFLYPEITSTNILAYIISYISKHIYIICVFIHTYV